MSRRSISFVRGFSFRVFRNTLFDSSPRKTKNRKLNTVPYITLALCLIAGASHQVAAAEAENHLAKARELAAADQPEAASIAFRNALQQNPDNVQARLQFGQIELKLGNGQTALKELAIAAGSLPEQETAVPLAEARLLAADYSNLAAADAEASRAAIRAISGLSDAQRARLMGLHGQAFLALDRPEDAQELFAAALTYDPGEPYALLGQIILVRRDNGLDEASLQLARLRDLHPEFAPAWSLAGDLARARSDWEGAEAAYTRAITLRRNHAYDLLHRALTRLALKDPAGAAADAALLQQTGRAGPGADYILGLVALQASDLAAADQHFSAALAVDASYLPAVLFAGVTAAAAGHPEQAQAHLVRYTNAFYRIV